MKDKDKTPLDAAIQRLKQHPAVLVVALAGAVIVWLASVTDSAGKLVSRFSGGSPKGTATPTLTVAQSPQPPPPTTPASTKPLLSIRLFPMAQYADRHHLVSTLRTESNLRPLTTVETGSRLADAPVGTYFTVSVVDLAALPDETRARISSREADDSQYEVHQRSNEFGVLLAYVSETDAGTLSSLRGAEAHLIVAPLPVPPFSVLALIPLDRPTALEPRYLDTPSGYTMAALDATIR